jgi:hypothetical protein
VLYLNLLLIRILFLSVQGAGLEVLDMAQALFRCSNAQGHVIDGRVVTADDLVEAREYATRVARVLQPGFETLGWAYLSGQL